MTAPTPGPWIVGPFDMIWPASDVEFSDGKWREKIPEPRIIASASKGNLLPDEDRANTHLMAAAPEMFEALEIIVRHWTGYLAEDELPDWPADPIAVMNDAWKDGFLEKAQAALAKASTHRDGPVLREGVA